MALEDLTGASKYISDLDVANPVDDTDERPEGAGHLRGTKNVLANTFPNIDAPVLCTPAELNVLTGKSSIPGGLPSGAEAVFYMAAAPTGWSRTYATGSLDGCTLRVVTGTAGGAEAGTHDLTAAPSTTHSHADTIADASHALSTAQMPEHFHYQIYDSETSDNSPDQSSTHWGSYWSNNNTSSTNKKYRFNTDVSDQATVGYTEARGSGVGHTHAVTGSVTDGDQGTAFAPKYVNCILAEKD
jgi:hypothetical protein